MELPKVFAKLENVQNEQIQNRKQPPENAQNEQIPDYNEPLRVALENQTAKSLVPLPNNPPWNRWSALGVWVASVIFIIVVPNILLVPYLIAKGFDLTNSQALAQSLLNDPTALLLSVLGIIPAHVLTILLAWLVVTNYKKFPFRETLGWKGGGFAWWHHIVVLIGFFAVAGVVSYFIPQQENEFLRLLQSSRTVVFAVAFMATFTAPLVEEVVYRGILYSAFQRTLGIPAAVLLVTALFALVHVPQYYPSYSTIILICLLSLVLTLIRVKTDNLLPCIILHTIFNGFQSILLIAEPYLPKPEQQIQEQAAALLKLIT